MLKIPYSIIKEWRKKLKQLRRMRTPILESCRVIADEFKINPNTVRYCLFQRKDYHKREYRREYNKYYNKSYRKRHEIRLKIRDYDYKYKRLVGHLDSILPQVFNLHSELGLGDISNEIKNLAGISLQESTLEKIIAKYEDKPRGSPIIKTKSKNYLLNFSFYNP